MFKLVVLCAFVACVAAEPGALLAPLTYSSAVLSPSTTTITRQASSVVHPSPLLYSAPLTYSHFIKKRSAPFALSPYIAPTYSYAASPLISTYAAPLYPRVPLVHSAPLAYSTAHLIKKRSAPLTYSTFFAPTTYTASAPLIASTYTTTPILHSAPLISHAPLTYPTHLIKKRSAPIALSTYVAPTSYSHQSRIDLHSSPLVTSYSTPIAYSSPIAYTSPISYPYFG